jgi:tetratricopeptide (TPR) repeat protein
MEMHVKRVAQLEIVLAAALAMVAVSCPCQTAVAADNQRQTAIALEQQGNNAEAETAWRAFLKGHPANAEAYAHVAFLEDRQERYTEAVPLYRKALALNPAMPGLRLNFGLSLFKSGALKEAIQTFTPLLKSQPPSSPEALRLETLIGLAHYGLGEYAAAVPFLKQATAADAQNLPFRLALAHSCLWSKQYQCVLDVYHEILTLNAESAEADMLAGEALDEMKDPEGAMREFRAAVQANPKEPNVHFGLGYLLWTKGQHPEAAKEFQTEIDNDPQHLQAMLYLADSEMQMNQTDDARPLLEKLVKISPDNAMAHLDLGIVYAEQGRKQDALAELQIAIKIAPDNVNARWRLGRLYRSMGMTAEAKAEFDKASSLNKAEDERLLKVMSTIPSSNRTSPAGVTAPANK